MPHCLGYSQDFWNYELWVCDIYYRNLKLMRLDEFFLCNYNYAMVWISSWSVWWEWYRILAHVHSLLVYLDCIGSFIFICISCWVRSCWLTQGRMHRSTETSVRSYAASCSQLLPFTKNPVAHRHKVDLRLASHISSVLSHHFMKWKGTARCR